MTDQLEALRQGAGPDTDIMVDLGSNFRVAGAIGMARHVERFGLSWLELELGSLDALKEVRSGMRIPVAGGERLRVVEYHALLRERAVDLPVVDLLFNGVSDSLHVAAACEAYEANIAIHNCYSPLATFMAAAFCAVAPNVQILEMDVDNVTWDNDFVSAAPRVQGGSLSLQHIRLGRRGQRSSRAGAPAADQRSSTVKIAHVTTRVLDTLDDSPLIEGLPEPGEHVGPRQLLALELGTDQGLVGLGVTFWHGALAPALKVALDVLAQRTLGMDPRQIEAIAARLQSATGRTSTAGKRHLQPRLRRDRHGVLGPQSEIR